MLSSQALFFSAIVTSQFIPSNNGQDRNCCNQSTHDQWKICINNIVFHNINDWFGKLFKKNQGLLIDKNVIIFLMIILFHHKTIMQTFKFLEILRILFLFSNDDSNKSRRNVYWDIDHHLGSQDDQIQQLLGIYTNLEQTNVYLHSKTSFIQLVFQKLS